MLTLILLSFIVTGVTAFRNFQNQNEEYNAQRLHRKELAIKRSMEYFMDQNQVIESDSIPVVFTDKICELSDVHNLSINLYSIREGQLLISSSIQAFDELGFSRVLDYTILKQLSTGNDRPVTVDPVQDNKYVLVYWYFKDLNGKPIAIVNVRYDEKDIESSELKRFLIDLTSIYVILFLGASLLAYFLSNYITRSLQNIGKKMHSVNLGKKNLPISWNSNDEIGTLVNEYNRMLKEVEQSAELLAKSERESAWREMAKQVAHEIKNPLTPMKLRVQHLERAWNDGPENFGEKLAGFSKTVIEQIDTLSNIASEFSNFAVMPKANKSDVDLLEILKSCIQLYQDDETISIGFKTMNVTEPIVFADKDQLIRVFNNLIKNAIQSIPKDRKGNIKVRLKEYDGMYIIEVEDNGSGISEEQRDKIFVPNFTTKSTGMGLGLAMVKSIIEQSGGDVWFKSNIEKGTSFFVALPVNHPNRQ